MHLTSSLVPWLTFWLMIVSTTIAVLPVWRSPMISWRCPRPIGVIESMALIPVCSGSFTGWRSTTDGAWVSRRRRSVVLIGPLPSTGLPNGSMTRPSRASPTGTESTVPVCLTGSPSWMWLASPRSTTPRSSSSMLSVTPISPPGNSSSSEAMTLGKPSTRATPSAMEVTYPTVSLSTSGCQPASCSLRDLVIWSAVMVRSVM